MSEQRPEVIARQMPEGVIPLISIEGAAYDVGREYAEIVMSRWPGFRAYLDNAWFWRELPGPEKKLVEAHAPHLIDLHRGITDVAGPPQAQPPKAAPAKSGCTSFSLSPAVTLDGVPMSGQTKDTPLNRIERYLVLRMKITGAPGILVLAYPGEVMGYGFWTTGMTLFRNSMFSSAGCPTGMHYTVMTTIMLSCKSVDEAVELVQKHGRNSAGNTLMADAAGNSVSFETNVGGQAFIRDVDGINVHTNHPIAENTRAYEKYEYADLQPDSILRYERLGARLEGERGRLTPQKIFQLLAIHEGYPLGTCKHRSQIGDITTAAVVVEPTRGLLHVTRGQPCCNWPATYSL